MAKLSSKILVEKYKELYTFLIWCHQMALILYTVFQIHVMIIPEFPELSLK